jgi:hypothetical protein
MKRAAIVIGVADAIYHVFIRGLVRKAIGWKA